MEKKITFIGFLSMFVVGVSDLIVVGLISPMATQFDVDKSLIGQLVTIYAVAFAVLGPLLTKITSRFNDKSILCMSFLVFIMCSFLTTVANSFMFICILRIILAGSAALITVKLLALGSKLVSENNKAKVVANIYVGFSAANILGVPIGTMLGDYFDWRFPFLLICIMSLISVSLIWRYINIKDGDNYQETKKTYSVLNKRGIIVVLLILVLMMTSNSILFTYLEPIMRGNGLTLEDVSIALFLAGLSGVVGSKLGNVLSEKYGFNISFIVICVTYVAAVIILMINTDSLLLVLISVSIWNLFHWGINPTVQYALLKFIKGDPSQIFSYNISLLNFGIGLGSLIGGVLFSKDSSFFYSFVFAILLGVVSLILVLLGLKGSNKYQSLKEYKSNIKKATNV
ncbi:MFS transporter [Bacillus pseudomycoides]|nr:MFS transporter [Bacillus pseudomycoides]